MTDEEKRAQFEKEYKDAMAELRGQVKQLGDAPAALAKMQSAIDAITKALEEYKAKPVHVTQPQVITPRGTSEELCRKMGVWFRANFCGDSNAQAEMKATSGMSEGVGTEGGYTVPTEVLPEIMRIAGEKAKMRPIVNIMPVGSMTKDIPLEASGVTISWPGERTAPAETKPVLGKAVLSIKTCMGWTGVTNELLQDSVVNIGAYLIKIFAEAFAKEEDKQCLVASAAPFTGLMAVSDTVIVDMGGSTSSGSTSFSKVTADDFSQMMAAVPESIDDNGHFFISRSCMHYVRTLKDKEDRPIYQKPSGPKEPAYIYGFPIVQSGQLPGIGDSAPSTKMCAYGDPKNITIGDRMTMTMKELRELKALENATVYATFARFGTVVGLPAGFSILKTSAT